MEPNGSVSTSTLMGTIGGTTLTFVSTASVDVTKTVVSAVLGALVSFGMSLFLQKFVKK